MWIAAILTSCVVVLAGCGTEAYWDPKYPNQSDYPQVVEVASRVRHPLPECSRIGVVHSDGDVDDVVPMLARKAADHGGTHYTIEKDTHEEELVTRSASHTTGSADAYRFGNSVHADGQSTTFGVSRTREESTRHIWAIVYRCKDDVREAD